MTRPGANILGVEVQVNRDYTPIQVARQGVRWVIEELLAEKPALMLDPCAGGGVFGRVFAEEYPEVLRWGVDIRPGTWTEHYNWTEVGPFQEVGPRLKKDPHSYACDLIITNPDFGIVYECLPIWLSLAPVVVLYCKDDLGQRSTTKGLYGNLPYPSRFARIPGAVFHRLNPATLKPQSDSRSYGWWVFENGYMAAAVGSRLCPLPAETSRWDCFNLPLLPAKDRQITFEETPDGIEFGETPALPGEAEAIAAALDEYDRGEAISSTELQRRLDEDDAFDNGEATCSHGGEDDGW